MLAQEGFLYIKQVRGTEILDFKATQKLQYVTSFSETLREQGFTVTQAQVSVNVVSAPRRIVSELRVEPGSGLVKLDRLTLANGAPIALMTNYLVTDLALGIERRIQGMSSFYSFLESEYQIAIEAATYFISARQPSPTEAEKLDLPRNSPLLVVRRITHSAGRPVEVAILLIVAEGYENCVHTKDRPPRRTVTP
jgi:GntR family transcriptional regulator